jgi:hypothetical protein
MYWFEDTASVEKTEFSVDQCREFAHGIKELFGTEWFSEQLKYPQHSSHPLVSKWGQTGVGSVTEFSTLFLDLKVLETCPGFPALLDNLRDAKKYAASVHEAHVGAFFKRGNVHGLALGQDVRDKKPDIKFDIGGRDFFAECKIFEESKVHSDFRDMAKRCCDRISDMMDERNVFCAVRIEFMKPFFNVSTERVMQTVMDFLPAYSGEDIVRSDNDFSIRIFKTPVFARGVEYKKAYMVHFISPIDPKEALRIRNTISKASKQLPDDGNNMICLELPHFSFVFPDQIISTIVKREFKQGHSEKIGAVLLNKRIMYPDAGRWCHCDYLYLLVNSKATNYISSKMIMDNIEPASWVEILPLRTGVPFYEYAIMPFHARFPASGGTPNKKGI